MRSWDLVRAANGLKAFPDRWIKGLLHPAPTIELKSRAVYDIRLIQLEAKDNATINRVLLAIKTSMRRGGLELW